MSKLIFYARAIALRRRYGNNDEYEKIKILSQIVGCTFKEYEDLPKKFQFFLEPLSQCYYSNDLILKISEVLEDLGYEKVSIKKTNSNKYILISIELLS